MAKNVEVQQSQQHVSEVEISGFQFRASSSQQISRGPFNPALLTWVNAGKFGMRGVLAAEVIERIGSPDKVQVALGDNGVAIGVNFVPGGHHFQLRKSGKKYVIYSAQLVEEVTEAFGLDFSGMTSLSFNKVTYHKSGDENIAVIDMTIQQCHVNGPELDSSELD